MIGKPVKWHWTPPAKTDWWKHPRPKQNKRCYPTKAEALKVFADYNEHIIEPYGGLDKIHDCATFDAVNLRYDIKGKSCANRMGDALWAAMPTGRPFCIDDIDLQTLNQIAPAIEKGGFQLPDFVVEEKLREEEEDYWKEAEKRTEEGWFGEAMSRIPWVAVALGGGLLLGWWLLSRR